MNNFKNMKQFIQKTLILVFALGVVLNIIGLIVELYFPSFHKMTISFFLSWVSAGILYNMFFNKKDNDSVIQQTVGDKPKTTTFPTYIMVALASILLYVLLLFINNRLN